MGIPTVEFAISRFFIAHRFNLDSNPGSSGSILFTSAASVIGVGHVREETTSAVRDGLSQLSLRFSSDKIDE